MIATDLSGLQAGTLYYFKVNGVEYSISTGGQPPDYYEVAQLMDTTLNSAGFAVVITGEAPFQDIRALNKDTRGWDSYVELGFGTSGNDLWTSLTGFTGFDEDVPGRGEFDIIKIATVEAGYGGTFNGAATYYFLGTPPVGTIYTGGTAKADEINVIHGDMVGSFTFDGTAITNVNYEWDPEAALASLDISIYNDVVYNESVYTSTRVKFQLGGTLTGVGEYELFNINAKEPIGGLTTYGIGDYEFDIIHLPTGSTTLSGNVVVDRIDFVTIDPTGAAIFAGIGTTTYTVRYRYLASGGLTATGEGEVIQERIYNGLYYGDYYYRFDQSSGTTAIDYFSNGNDLTVSSASLWTDDAEYYRAIDFGKADYSTLTSDIQPQAISFWHKFQVGESEDYVVFGANSVGDRWYFAYDVMFRRCLIKNGTNYNHFLDGTDYVLIPDDGEYHWYYIEFYSGSNATLYIDNIQRGTASPLFGTSGTGILNTIGNTADSTDGYVRGFGLLDDMRIYESYRLDSTRREAVFTLSPDPGGIITGGSADVQPVIVAGGEYVYEPTGGMITNGERLSYLAEATAIVLSGTADDAELGAVYDTIITTIITNSQGSYQDFGLGLNYYPDGDMFFSGSAEYEGIAYFSYDATTEPIEIFNTGYNMAEIETADGGYFILFESLRRFRLSGSAIYKLFSYIYYPSGQAVASGTIDDPVKGLTTKDPSGSASVSGAATYSWAPESGYQELGLD